MGKDQWLRTLSLDELQAFIAAAETDYSKATTPREEAIALSKARDGALHSNAAGLPVFLRECGASTGIPLTYVLGVQDDTAASQLGLRSRLRPGRFLSILMWQ